MNFESDIGQGPIQALFQKRSSITLNLIGFISNPGCDERNPNSIKLWLDDLHYLIYQYSMCSIDFERELKVMGRWDDAHEFFDQRYEFLGELELVRDQKVHLLCNSFQISIRMPDIKSV